MTIHHTFAAQVTFAVHFGWTGPPKVHRKRDGDGGRV